MAQDDVERVDTLRYMWQKLQSRVAELQSILLEVQSRFKISLLDSVQVYVEDVHSFVGDYSLVSGTWGHLPMQCLSVRILLPLCRKGRWWQAFTQGRPATNWLSFK